MKLANKDFHWCQIIFFFFSVLRYLNFIGVSAESHMGSSN